MAACAMAPERGEAAVIRLGIGGHEIVYLDLEHRLMIVRVDLSAKVSQPGLRRELFRFPNVESNSLYSGPCLSRADLTPSMVRIPRASAAVRSRTPVSIVDDWPALIN